jgi:hypothetical protein
MVKMTFDTPSKVFCLPTTKAVGSNFVTSIVPTALVVGARKNKKKFASFPKLAVI